MIEDERFRAMNPEYIEYLNRTFPQWENEYSGEILWGEQIWLAAQEAAKAVRA